MGRRVIASALVGVVFVACASQGDGGGGFDGGGTVDAGKGKDATLDAPGLPDVLNLDTSASDATCAAEKFTAESAPAAMLFVLDASGSMGNDNKWADAQQAIVTAMDLHVFDSLSLGLLAYPQVTKELAMCPALKAFGVKVNCEVSGLPQVPLTLAGKDVSNTTGVRKQIYDTLVADSPTAGPGNGNPVYDAMQTGIGALQGFKTTKRLMFFITDGGASCTSQDTPQRPYYKDGNGCDDWEDPDNIVTMLKNAHDDPVAPVNTLVVGVKGADNTDPQDNPPYRIRLALSAYALAGSPETVPSGCDGTYTKSGSDPTLPCHFDLTTTPSFSSALSTDIETIRNQLLGCTFALPTPKSGTLDTNKVNVQYSTGGKPIPIDKRAKSSDPCTTGAGCWDYDASGDVQLIGNACTAVEGSKSANVQILVGCDTIIK